MSILFSLSGAPILSSKNRRILTKPLSISDGLEVQPLEDKILIRHEADDATGFVVKQSSELSK